MLRDYTIGQFQKTCCLSRTWTYNRLIQSQKCCHYTMRQYLKEHLIKTKNPKLFWFWVYFLVKSYFYLYLDKTSRLNIPFPIGRSCLPCAVGAICPRVLVILVSVFNKFFLYIKCFKSIFPISEKFVFILDNKVKKVCWICQIFFNFFLFFIVSLVYCSQNQLLRSYL